MNTEKLALGLNAGEGYLIFSQENRRYFTRFDATDGWLLVTKQERILLTDSRYIEAANAMARDCTEVILLTSLKEQLPALCEKLGVNVLFIEDSRMDVATLRNLRKMLPAVTVEDSPRLSEEIEVLRQIKVQEETDCILAAQSIAEKAFAHILGFARVGVTQKDIALELDFFMLKNGAEALSFETIAVSGPESSMPHGVPTLRKLQRGDFLTLDYGAVVKGYHSDMTRTLGVGEVSSEQQKVYQTVLDAQLAALNAMQGGALCREVDSAARRIINKAGYGACFGHSTGHGVGVEIHEAPTISPKSGECRLQAGNIVTAEPGIYLPGRFGVRIEDMALVTAEGHINLTTCPKELIVL